MPCSSSEGQGSYQWSDHPTTENFKRLEKRTAELEQALCGLCQQLTATNDPTITRSLHPQLQAWFDAHRQLPGCEAK